jgi:hypothetical protein
MFDVGSTADSEPTEDEYAAMAVEDGDYSDLAPEE